MDMADLVESLQTALELERRGRAFYLDASDRVQDKIVKGVLVDLANDEEAHEQAIGRFYQALEKHQAWPSFEGGEGAGHAPERVQEIVESSVGNIGSDATFVGVYETACELEVKSRDFYREQADAADERRLEEFFRFLARVEDAHLKALGTMVEATRRAGGAKP